MLHYDSSFDIELLEVSPSSDELELLSNLFLSDCRIMNY